MLNFNKKKYVSFDNLSSFSGMIQKAMSDKLNNVESRLKQMIDSRFQSLTSKEQGDSEVIDAREGKLTLLENLRTFVKSDKYIVDLANTDAKIRNVKSDVDDNTTWRFQNMKPIQSAIDFVNNFRVEANLDNQVGYIKLPNVFGGLILQWGSVGYISPILDYRFEFPRTFDNVIYATVASPKGSDGNWGATTNFTNIGLSVGRIVAMNNNLDTENAITWFAIGR